MPFPLQNVRVIDLTNVIAGPVACRFLAALGAQVIKVEAPWGRAIGRVQMHGTPQGVDHPYNRIAAWNEVNRAKLSISLNLAQEAGKEVFRRLVSISDVVVENYSPRVMGNLGLHYEALLPYRPDLIMISMPALGSSGPWENYTSFGPGTDALAGLSDITGYEDGPPSKPGNYYADHNSSFHVAFAVMTALHHRARAGEGQRIEVALREAVMAVMGESFLEYQMTGRSPGRKGNRDDLMAPHGIYPCRGEDEWVAIAVASDQEWSNLRSALGDPEWAQDQRFDGALGRHRCQREMDEGISAWTRRRSHYQAMRTLQRHGVRAGAVLKAPEISQDPHFAALGFLDVATHPQAGTGIHPGLPWRFSSAETRSGVPAPLFAQHNDYVLRDLLHYSQEEVERLRRDRIVLWEPQSGG